MNQKTIKHRIQRLTIVKDALELKYIGKEQNYTFYGGWDLGYVQGQLSVLEDLLEGVNE